MVGPSVCLNEQENGIKPDDTRAVLLLKKIELSKGYETYRKERLMQGVAKPPIVLTKDKSRNDSPSKVFSKT